MTLAGHGAPSVARGRLNELKLLSVPSQSTDAVRSKLPAAAGWFPFFGLLCIVALFYVFTYNSGYGYDTLEYLVIGRAIAHGQPFYSLIPSKSPGIYYLIATFLSLRLPANHYTVSALITLLFAVTLVGTWFVVRRSLGYRAAIASTLLVAACAAFMEMNFLEPESLVLLCGLGGFVLVLRSVRTANLLPLFAAGIVLAIGLQFKSVAAFYVAGIFCFLVFKQLCQRQLDVKDLLRGGAVLSAGVFTGSIVPLLFFAATGRLSEFWTWTITFPLFHYPSNTFWLDKLYTKLLWFHLLLVASFLCSIIVVRIRRTVWASDAAALAFFMGLVSYLALLKTQASHYCFPGAAFFSIFISVVLVSSPRKLAGVVALPRWIALAAPAGLLVVALSVVLYEPQALSRLAQWRNFQEEELIGSQVRQQLGPGRKGLFVRNGSFLYWVSGAEPAWRFIYFDAQTTYFVERNPDSLLNALNDQSTAIVEFDPVDPSFADERFSAYATKSHLLVEFTSAIEKQFRPADISAAPFHFWVRKSQ